MIISFRHLRSAIPFKSITKVILFFVFVFISSVDIANAYIGPGAGFAFISSFFILFVTFVLAIFYLLTWPLRHIIRALFRKNKAKSDIKRVIIIGLDGMDPNLVEEFMNKGEMPNFQKLKEKGTFSRLATSYPSICLFCCLYGSLIISGTLISSL